MPRALGGVPPRDLVLLWSRAAGRCSHPDCKLPLILDATGQDVKALVGEAAHIVAAAPRGPRGGSKPESTLHNYENLILLCRHHHAVIDRQAGSHSVEVLHTWKAEHEAWVAAVTSVADDTVPWTAIVQEILPQTDVIEAQAALGPDHRVVRLEALRGSPAPNGWQAAAARERESIDRLLAETPAERRRFAVFPMGRIALAVQLGYLLDDRACVWLFQYDRDSQTWAWLPDQDRSATSLMRPRLRRTRKRNGRAALRVSLSAQVLPQDVADVVDAEFDLEIAARRPSVRWLSAPRQLDELARAYAEALTLLRRRNCCRVDLFYAGPAPGAVAFGRAYNPSMNPPLFLYEYTHSARPRYRRVLELNGAPGRA